MKQVTAEFKGYTITTDKSLMNLADIHKWLSEEAYWCKNIPYEMVKTAFENSFCIGVVLDGRQIAFGRMITDYAVFGYLADVYVLEEHRGKGISKMMMAMLLGLDWTKKLHSIKLATKDAHELYKRFGFTQSTTPERMMEISRPNQYSKPNNIL